MITEPNIKKTTANDTIIQMLANLNIDRRDLFYQSAERYLKQLSPSGETFFRIKRLLDQKPPIFKEFKQLPQNIQKLLELTEGCAENVFVNDETSVLIDELLMEWKNRDVYNQHNLKVRNKILLHGETGNGKTTIAKYIAKKTELPFFEVKAGDVIDSRLGETASNIQEIFKSINQPSVIFWDEIDSIGNIRSDSNKAADTENNRMTNSILVNIDKLKEEVIFIGATNRYKNLDSAFLRRFDLKYEIKKPSESEKEMFYFKLLKYYNIEEKKEEDTKWLSGLESYNEIKIRMISIARNIVLDKIRAANN